VRLPIPPLSLTKQPRALFCLVIVSSYFHLSACAITKYQAQPITIEQVNQKIEQKSPSNPAFQEYLRKQGYTPDQLPIRVWDLDLLTLSALYYHSALDVAKSKLAVAESNVDLASLRSAIGVSGKLGRSNQANNDISPWVYGLQIDIPIVTANKREIRIEEAQHQSEVARIDVAETAWSLRQQLTTDLVDFYSNQHLVELLNQETVEQQKLLDILQKRLSHGLASRVEVANATFELQRKRSLLRNEQTKTNSILAKIAADAGLSMAQFNPSTIKVIDIEALIAQQNLAIESQSLQKEALLNRMDIRRGLANYAVAETRLKLEIAKQTPDITLSPSYMFELGDKIWSLGFSSLISLINPQHAALIKQAELLRRVEGANFEAIQSNVLSSLSQAKAQYDSALKQLNEAKNLKILEAQNLARIHRQLTAGNTDRLAYTQATIASMAANQQYLQAQFALLHAQLNIENLIQKPLITQASMINK
jgi:outer membrane protein, heavy metal efflux system